jgi:hypothetical protein
VTQSGLSPYTKNCSELYEELLRALLIAAQGFIKSRSGLYKERLRALLIAAQGFINSCSGLLQIEWRVMISVEGLIK